MTEYQRGFLNGAIITAFAVLAAMFLAMFAPI